MGRLIPVAADRVNGRLLPTPAVVYINSDRMKISVPEFGNRVRTKVQEYFDNGGLKMTYELFAVAGLLDAMIDFASTDILKKQFIALGLAAAGTIQGTATVITKKFSEFTGIAAGATDGAKLPAAVVGAEYIVVNNDATVTDTLKVYPFLSDFIDSLAVNVNTTVLVGARKHFVCRVAGKWITANDNGD